MAPEKRTRPVFPQWFERRIGRYAFSDSWTPSGDEWDEDLSDYEPPPSKEKKDRGPPKKKIKVDNEEDGPSEARDDGSANEDDTPWDEDDVWDEDDYTSDDDGHCSDISAADSMTEIYREFKVSRDRRKEELHEMAEFAKNIEKEADEAHKEFLKSLKSGETYPMPSLHRTRYYFYSADQHLYTPQVAGRPWVMFYQYPPDEAERFFGPLPPDYDENVVSGQLSLDGDGGSEFKFLRSDTLNDNKFVVLDETERYDLTFQFLGEKHIKLSFSKGMLGMARKYPKRRLMLLNGWVFGKPGKRERKNEKHR